MKFGVSAMDGLELYSNLYDIVKSNMPKDEKLLFSKEIFLASKGEAMDRSDLLRLRELEKRDFMIGAYAIVFRRLPESERVIEKGIMDDLPKEAWRGRMIGRVINSNEYLSKDLPCENNIYYHELRETKWGGAIKNRIVQWMYREYQKAPAWLRKVERRLAVLTGIIDD